MGPRGLNLGGARRRRKGQVHGQMHGCRLMFSLEAKAEGRGSKRKESKMENVSEFQGWTNRETWATNLHLDNDQYLQLQCLAWAKDEISNVKIDQAVYELAQRIQNWVEEDLLCYESIKKNHNLWLMLSDIGSLYRVNWTEIADNFLALALSEASA